MASKDVQVQIARPVTMLPYMAKGPLQIVLDHPHALYVPQGSL